MTKTSVQLKAQAKQQLKGRWKQIIFATLTIMVVMLVSRIVPLFFNIEESDTFLLLIVKIVEIIIATLLIAPLRVGLTSYTLKFIKGQELEISEAFSGFNRFKDSAILSLLINVFLLLWLLPFGILFGLMAVTIGIVIIILFFLSITVLTVIAPIILAVMAPLCIVLIFVIYIALFVVLVVKSISYSMSYYILVENPNMKPREALKWSTRITNGHKKTIFYVGLSFIGWGIVAIFTLGIGFIWLIPYKMVTYTNLYSDIKELNPEYNVIVPGYLTDIPTEEKNNN